MVFGFCKLIPGVAEINVHFRGFDGSSQNNLHNRGLNEMHEIFSAHFAEQHLSKIEILL